MRANGVERGLLVAVDLRDPRRPLEPDLVEFEALIEAAGAQVAGRIVQRLDRVDPATLVGSGKAHEVARVARDVAAGKLFVFNALRPRQRSNLEKLVELPVVDRSMVILDIFAQRARSREGKLQVEMAQLRHRQANLIGAGSALSRLGGGVGTRGPGETKLEVDRRRIAQRISTLRAALEHVRRARHQRRSTASGTPLAALVGYTNVGKSSLLNRLARGSGGEAFVADQPFATLDPTLRRVYLGEQRFARVADTVGFVTELPKELVTAFRATLEELAEADVLIHVVDASNPEWERQVASVRAILHELDVDRKPTIFAFNKSDAATSAVPAPPPGAIATSAKTGLGMAALRTEIARRLDHRTAFA
ncbi:MAG: GTPase HflX [Candidatus Eremiobacteraeota bacterium]|nr:GTPase HflX [Candidatus Eremiobacteraeota bacterium]MBV9647449.1 GTPase HflX [Candidatus Eremiobacteraeota bacterium]